MDPMIQFARNLRERRKELGLTQGELAARIDVTPQTISGYENYTGKKGKTPTLEKVIDLSKALGKPIDYLCGLNDNAQQMPPMNTVGDVIEAVKHIAEAIPCYAEVKERKLTSEEYMRTNPEDVPDDLATKTSRIVNIVIDSPYVAEFIDMYLKLKNLHDDGAFPDDVYHMVLDAQLNRLKETPVRTVSNSHVPVDACLSSLERQPIDAHEPTSTMRELIITRPSDSK